MASRPARISSPASTTSSATTSSEPGRVLAKPLREPPDSARTDRSAPSVSAPAPDISRSSIHSPLAAQGTSASGRHGRRARSGLASPDAASTRASDRHAHLGRPGRCRLGSPSRAAIADVGRAALGRRRIGGTSARSTRPGSPSTSRSPSTGSSPRSTSPTPVTAAGGCSSSSRPAGSAWSRAARWSSVRSSISPGGSPAAASAVCSASPSTPTTPRIRASS